MQDIVIDIAADGVVRGMHRDEFNLGFLGKQKIERASEIKFNADSQKWEIFIPHRKHNVEVLIEECGTFDSYNEARAFEVAWMNNCRFHSADPESDKGRTIADALRRLDEEDKAARRSG